MITRSRERIRALNDGLRQRHSGGRIMITPGILALGSQTIQRIDDALMTYSSFDADDDPYGEHDFGSFTVDGQVVFFKIDYYDLDLRNHSPDPSDPEVTCRVLTLMLAAEY